MLKLYKKIDGQLHYFEAWCNEGVITTHWGIVGEQGESRETKLPKDVDEEDAILAAVEPAGREGFQPIDIDDHAILLIEYKVEGFGNPGDLDKRHRLEDRMSGTLGWTGLGMCDGGSIGSGTMETCCYVVDFEIAKRVIEVDLNGTEFSDFTRIYRMDVD